MGKERRGGEAVTCAPSGGHSSRGRRLRERLQPERSSLQ
jgi:hypothetical protein